MLFFLRRHLVAILILLGGAVVLTAVFILLQGHTDRVSRDFQRLSDMHVIRSSFERLYQDNGSYEVGNCDDGALIHQCLLSDYDSNNVIRRDPGEFSYTIVTSPTVNTYGVSFTLEGSYRDLDAGEHLLTENGIQ